MRVYDSTKFRLKLQLPGAISIMNSFALFTDVSLQPQLRLGIGTYLLVPVSFLQKEPGAIVPGEVSAQLKFKKFTETSSTKLEVQTVLWALKSSRQEMNGSFSGSLQIYTDSQCVAGLVRRRDRLLNSDFVAKRSGRPLANALLYRDFYEVYDQFGFQLHKVAGHSPATSHDTVQRIFSYVDRGVRQKLTEWLGAPEFHKNTS